MWSHRTCNRKRWGGPVVRKEANASTGAVTYVFKGQDYGGNDAGYKNYNPQDAEKTLALGEVHLWREELRLRRGAAQKHSSRSKHSPPLSGSRRLWRRCRRPLWCPPRETPLSCRRNLKKKTEKIVFLETELMVIYRQGYILLTWQWCLSCRTKPGSGKWFTHSASTTFSLLPGLNLSESPKTVQMNDKCDKRQSRILLNRERHKVFALKHKKRHQAYKQQQQNEVPRVLPPGKRVKG